MEEKKALIAMCGGVDSSVAAWLTLQVGYRCAGGTMRLFDETLVPGTREDYSDAEAVARRLDIPYHVFDLSKTFREKVVDDFISCYEQGATPNPCIVCNRHLKFSALLQEAEKLGCEKLVTGHYAQIQKDEENGRYLLKKAADAGKDQSFFLFSLTLQQLSRVLFPLGAMTKEQVREIARQQNFTNAHKQDSQDICFIPDGDYVAFIKRVTGKEYPCGDFLDLSGKVVGQHPGAICCTIGQRKGLGLAMGAPVYVCSKDMQRNTVTVGPNEALFRTTLRANDWNWISIPQLDRPIRAEAKVRYRHTPQPATVYPEENGYARVEFDEPQRAITAGQAVVIYDGDMVIGGGTITEVL